MDVCRLVVEMEAAATLGTSKTAALVSRTPSRQASSELTKRAMQRWPGNGITTHLAVAIGAYEVVFARGGGGPARAEVFTFRPDALPRKAEQGTGLVGVPGFEPGTSSLSEKRSNRLSYTPPARQSSLGRRPEAVNRARGQEIERPKTRATPSWHWILGSGAGPTGGASVMGRGAGVGKGRAGQEVRDLGPIPVGLPKGVRHGPS